MPKRAPSPLQIKYKPKIALNMMNLELVYPYPQLHQTLKPIRFFLLHIVFIYISLTITILLSRYIKIKKSTTHTPPPTFTAHHPRNKTNLRGQERDPN